MDIQNITRTYILAMPVGARVELYLPKRIGVNMVCNNCWHGNKGEEIVPIKTKSLRTMFIIQNKTSMLVVQLI